MGGRFPGIMIDLYGGDVPPDRASAAKRELESIRAQLRRFSPSDVVWDYENLSARLPWGDNIAARVILARSTFIDSSLGRGLTTRFEE